MRKRSVLPLLLMIGVGWTPVPQLARGVIQGNHTAPPSSPSSAAAHYNRANQLVAQGDLEGAIAEYLQALRLKPESVDAHKRLAGVLERKGDWEGASRECREALRLRPADAEAHACLGRALDRKGDWDGAIAEFRQALVREPEAAEIHNGLGRALKAKGDRDGAAEEFRQALLAKPGYGEAHYNLGLLLQSKRDFDGAVAEYREALRFKPDLVDAHSQLGIALQAKGDSEGCLRELWQAAILMPRSSRAHQNLALALAAQGDLKRAIAQYREATRLEPNDPLAHYNLGIALDQAENKEEAVVEFREAVRAKPDFPEAHSNLGNALEETGDIDGAIKTYREALRLKPDFPQAHNNLGRALEETGDLKAAIAEYREALRLKPDYPRARFNLGFALREEKNLEGAIAEYRQAVRLKPDFLEAHQSLARTLEANGDPGGAIAEYLEVLRLEPDNSLARNDLAQALRAKGDFDGAVAALHEEVRRSPGNFSAHNNLGLLLVEKGDLGLAIAEYHRALRLKRDFFQAHNNLGNALLARGDPEAAVAEYREAIALKPDYAQAHHNLAVALKSKGDPEGAVGEYHQAIRLEPGLAQAHNNLGAELDDQKDLEGAIAEYREALRVKPDYAAGHHNLAVALQSSGDLEGALAEYRQALRLRPELALPENNLESSIRDKANLDAWISECRGGMVSAPGVSPAHSQLEGTGKTSGSSKRAGDKCREVDWLGPDYAAPLYALGNSPDVANPFGIVSAAPHQASVAEAGLARQFHSDSFLGVNTAPEKKEKTAAVNAELPPAPREQQNPSVPYVQTRGGSRAPSQSRKTAKKEWTVIGRVITLKGAPVHEATVRVEIGAGPDAVKTIETNLKGDFETDFSLDANSFKTLMVKITAAKTDCFDAQETLELQSPGKSRRVELVLRESPEDVHQLPLASLVSSTVTRLRSPQASGLASESELEGGTQYARTLLTRGDPAGAVQALLKVVQVQSACARCRTLLALALLARGSWSSALQELTQAATLSASEKGPARAPEPFLVLGVLETWRGRMRRAEVFFLQALEIEPSNSLALQELGRVLILEQRTKSADLYLKRVIQAGASADAHLLRARALLDEGVPGEAEAEMQAYLGDRKTKELPRELRLEWLRMQTRLQIESKGRVRTVVDAPLSELAELIPDVKGLQPAASQGELALILRKVGESVKAFFESFPNTSSLEEVTAQHLRSNGKVAEFDRRKFRYLLLSQAEHVGLGLEEYRTDVGGNRSVTQAFGGQYMITEGFASQSLHFHPAFQSGSRFRYLGRQLVNNVDTYVVAFAQRPETASVLEDFRMKGGNVVVLVQGIVWIHPAAYQIIRIRTDLLRPEPEIRLRKQITDIRFGNVQFAGSSSRFWLPQDVAVTVSWNGKVLRNFHRYSDYQLFKVEAREKLKGPKIILPADSDPP